MNRTRMVGALPIIRGRIILSPIVLAIALGGCVAFDDSSDQGARLDNCARTPGCTSSASPSGYGSQQSRSVEPVGPGGVSPRR